MNELNHDVFSRLFSGSASGSGEEEMLRIATKYSRQITSRQMRCLSYLYIWANATSYVEDSKRLLGFIDYWLGLKDYHNSAPSVHQFFSELALHRYINEDSFKVAIQKGGR